MVLRVSPIESGVAAPLTTGAIAQLALVAVLTAVTIFPDTRKAVLTLFQPAARPGWAIALSVLAVEVVVLYVGWIKDFSKLADVGLLGVSMSPMRHAQWILMHRDRAIDESEIWRMSKSADQALLRES